LRRVFNDQRPRQGKLAERILSPDEQTRILAYCGRVSWLRPIILIAVLQALRLGEVLALRPEDVDFKAGKLTVLRSLRKDGSYGPTKGWKETDERELHVIDLHTQAAEILRSLTPLSPEAPYFRNTLGEQRAYQGVGKAWGKVRKLAALSADPRLPRFHDLRHTAISRLGTLPALRFPGCRSSPGTRRFRPPTSTSTKSAMRSASRPHGQPCRSSLWNTLGTQIRESRGTAGKRHPAVTV
jgi:integrase